MQETKLFQTFILTLLSISVAQAGKLCTKTETTAQGTYLGYYHVTFNSGDDATVDGTQCVVLAATGEEDCFPAYGEITYEKGLIELATSGSNDVIVPPYGKVTGFATRHTEIDATTKVGTSTIVTTWVAGGKSTQQIDSAVVTVIDCPKPTETDRDNARNLKKFIKGYSVRVR